MKRRLDLHAGLAIMRPLLPLVEARLPPWLPHTYAVVAMPLSPEKLVSATKKDKQRASRPLRNPATRCRPLRTRPGQWATRLFLWRCECCQGAPTRRTPNWLQSQ